MTELNSVSFWGSIQKKTIDMGQTFDYHSTQNKPQSSIWGNTSIPANDYSEYTLVIPKQQSTPSKTSVTPNAIKPESLKATATPKTSQDTTLEKTTLDDGTQVTINKDSLAKSPPTITKKMKFDGVETDVNFILSQDGKLIGTAKIGDYYYKIEYDENGNYSEHKINALTGESKKFEISNKDGKNIEQTITTSAPYEDGSKDIKGETIVTNGNEKTTSSQEGYITKDGLFVGISSSETIDTQTGEVTAEYLGFDQEDGIAYRFASRQENNQIVDTLSIIDKNTKELSIIQGEIHKAENGNMIFISKDGTQFVEFNEANGIVNEGTIPEE